MLPNHIKEQIADRVIRLLAPLVILAGGVALTFTFLFHQSDHNGLYLLLLYIIFITPAWLMARAGKPNRGIPFILLSLTFPIIAGMIFNGGVRAPVLIGVLPIVTIIYCLYGQSKAIAFSVLALIISGIFVILESRQLLPYVSQPPAELILLVYGIWLAFAVIFISVPVEMMFNALRESERQRLTVEDEISKKELVQNKLQESEEKYRLLAENSGDVIWTMDLNQNFTYISPSVKGLRGYTPEEIMTESIEDKLTPPFRKKAIKALETKTELNTPVIFTAEQPCKDGSTVWVEMSVRRLIDDSGKEIGLIGTSRNITERKKFEEEKEELENQLQHTQKIEAIGTLAGGIAHDFNNILSPIIGNTELAMMDVDNNNPIKLNLDEIMKAGLRAKDLVQQILAFSRQREQQKAPVQMGLIIKEISKLLRSSIPTTIDIRYDIKAKMDTVLADPTQIHQVIMNLCTNASHAMGENGGALEIELDDLYLESNIGGKFTDLNPGSYLRLTVRDTGHGIKPEVMDKIFEPYFTTKEIGIGTGIGLAVVHGIVQSFGGDINVESTPGEGSSFQVLFPKYETEVLEEKQNPDSLPSGTEQILLVDDEKATIDVVKVMLERLGYKVATRTSSIEALEAFRNQPNTYDLVITDMTMPNMTGKDLAKELMTIQPDIPVILCTGFSEQIDKRSADEMGIKAFIMKPVIMRDIADTIRKVLDKK